MTTQTEIPDQGKLTVKAGNFQPGQQVWLDRGNLCSAIVLHDHRPDFAAVSVRYRGNEWTVGVNEVLDYDHYMAEKQAREERNKQRRNENRQKQAQNV